MSLLARSGAHVAAGYARDRTRAEELQKTLAAEGASVSVHQHVGDADDCRRVVDEALRERGHVDFPINNAGITVDKTVRKMTVEDWHAVLRANLSGVYMTKALLEHMIERN